jgi:hypothetical protein
MSATSLIDNNRDVDGLSLLSSVEMLVVLKHFPKRPQKSDQEGVGDAPSRLHQFSLKSNDV